MKQLGMLGGLAALALWAPWVTSAPAAGEVSDSVAMSIRGGTPTCTDKYSTNEGRCANSSMKCKPTDTTAIDCPKVAWLVKNNGIYCVGGGEYQYPDPQAAIKCYVCETVECGNLGNKIPSAKPCVKGTTTS